MLLWATPHSLNEEGTASYVVSLSPIQDTADVVTYSLPGSRHTALLGGLQPGVTYQVILMTGTPSGPQPFYSANVTTMLGGVSESVWSGIGGGGVMLVIVLVVCGVTVLVCFIVWKMRRRRKSTMNERWVECFRKCFHKALKDFHLYRTCVQWHNIIFAKCTSCHLSFGNSISSSASHLLLSL